MYHWIAKLLLTILIFQNVAGISVSTTRIQHNNELCYLNWFNENSIAVILYGSGSFPTCPSSYTGTRITLFGLYCASGSQNLDVIGTDVNKYVIGVPNPPTDQTGTEKELDSSGGVTKVKMNYITSDINAEIWCASNTAATSWSPKGNTDICYGVPATTEKITLCRYTVSECSIDGTCYMETVSSSLNMYPVYPFFSTVFSTSQVEYTFSDL